MPKKINIGNLSEVRKYESTFVRKYFRTSVEERE
jgi:hypothetical protein